MGSNDEHQCMSCGKPVTEKSRAQGASGNVVPIAVPDLCWQCWTTMSVYHRVLVVIAIRDRNVGGVLSELAAAIDRLDQSRDDDDGDTWKLSE